MAGRVQSQQARITHPVLRCHAPLQAISSSVPRATLPQLPQQCWWPKYATKYATKYAIKYAHLQRGALNDREGSEDEGEEGGDLEGVAPAQLFQLGHHGVDVELAGAAAACRACMHTWQSASGAAVRGAGCSV